MGEVDLRYVMDGHRLYAHALVEAIQIYTDTERFTLPPKKTHNLHALVRLRFSGIVGLRIKLHYRI